MATDAERAVRDLEAIYDAAWSRGDVEAVLECLADDIVLISPRGDVARGRQDVEHLLRNFLASEAQGTTHVSALLRVEFVTEDVAVVDGEAVISRASDGDEPAVLHHGFTDVLVMRDRRWQIAHIRGYPRREP